MKNPNFLRTLYQWFMDHHIIIALCAIMLIGAYLRLNDFDDLLRFNNDQVRDLKIVDAMIMEREFPLLGPKAGGTTFKLGPAFYYMEYLSALIFGNTPHGTALFIPILGTFSIIMLYTLLKKYFSSSLALILTFFYATSFYVIKYARFAWNPNAIPFFLFLFFLILIKTLTLDTKHRTLWFVALGITSGVAMQLHTTLLILLPFLIMITHGFKYVQTKKIFFKEIALTYGMIIFLLSPMIIYDVQNDGKNITAFFHGSETKSAKNSSFVENIFLDGQIFIQSTAYVITGIEPTKNWTHPKKFLTSNNYKEISLALVGVPFFLFALYFFIKRQNTQRTDEQKIIHVLFISMIILCFLLFLPIVHEINTRFFIILIFIPFVFLGLFFEKILHNTTIPRIVRVSLIVLISCTILIANIITYHKVYNLSHAQASSDLYGGISMQELHAITQYMSDHTDHASQDLHLLPYTYGQSLRYVAHQKNIPLSSTAPNNIPLDTKAFYLSEKVTDTDLPKKISSCFIIEDTKKIFRFRIFSLQKTSNNCE